jgi:hypothetical protein
MSGEVKGLSASSRTKDRACRVRRPPVWNSRSVLLKEGRRLDGSAGLEVAYEGAPPAALATDVTGIVATAPDHPAGTGLAALAAMAQGKSVEGSWTVRLLTLPHGLGPDDVDELFLLLLCEYAS